MLPNCILNIKMFEFLPQKKKKFSKGSLKVIKNTVTLVEYFLNVISVLDKLSKIVSIKTLSLPC